MMRNPLVRHVALVLAAKALLIGLGLWWFLAGLPEPRGVVPAPAVTAPGGRRRPGTSAPAPRFPVRKRRTR